MTARGERTKARLLDAAERLFAQRGADDVSLREINAAAGERNNAALYYHFRGREGLLRAVADRHMPVLAARQQALLVAAEREGRTDLRSMVEVVVRPAAEYLGAGSSQRAWLRISSDVGTGPQTAHEDIATASSAAAWTAGVRILQHLEVECGLPNEFAAQRIWTAMGGAMHALANRARYEEARDPRRSVPPLEVFIEDLLDITCGVLTAPMSEQTRAALDHGPRSDAERLPM